MTRHVTCPVCNQHMRPSWIDARWRGLLPWHKGVDTVVICPGTETYAPLPPDGQEQLL